MRRRRKSECHVASRIIEEKAAQRKSEFCVTNDRRQDAEERISAGSARCLHPLTQIPAAGTTGPKIRNTKDSKYKDIRK